LNSTRWSQSRRARSSEATKEYAGELRGNTGGADRRLSFEAGPLVDFVDHVSVARQLLMRREGKTEDAAIEAAQAIAPCPPARASAVPALEVGRGVDA
jgi:hypothetical protein